MPTRVAFVAPSFPPSDGGGQRYNHELATAFVRAGCHVRVVTPFSGPAFHAYGVCKIAGIVQYKQIRIMSPIGLGRAIKSFSPDIIQTAGPDPNELTAAAVRRRISPERHLRARWRRRGDVEAASRDSSAGECHPLPWRLPASKKGICICKVRCIARRITR